MFHSNCLKIIITTINAFEMHQLLECLSSSVGKAADLLSAKGIWRGFESSSSHVICLCAGITVTKPYVLRNLDIWIYKKLVAALYSTPTVLQRCLGRRKSVYTYLTITGLIRLPFGVQIFCTYGMV